MAAIARPLTSTQAGDVELRCPGAHSESKWLGEPCGRLLATAQHAPVAYTVTLSCPRCRTRTTFEVTGG